MDIFKSDISKKRILIVDDAGSMRSLLHAVLMSIGFSDIDEASDGESALKRLESRPYDLVFCDWEMPKMDGVELYQQLNSQQKLRNIPFILVTSLAQAEKVKAAMAEGISEYVIKPFKEETIIKKLKKFFDD